jgi:hypothetical protein
LIEDQAFRKLAVAKKPGLGDELKHLKRGTLKVGWEANSKFETPL